MIKTHEPCEICKDRIKSGPTKVYRKGNIGELKQLLRLKERHITRLKEKIKSYVHSCLCGKEFKTMSGFTLHKKTCLYWESIDGEMQHRFRRWK